MVHRFGFVLFRCSSLLITIFCLCFCLIHLFSFYMMIQCLGRSCCFEAAVLSRIDCPLTRACNDSFANGETQMCEHCRVPLVASTDASDSGYKRFRKHLQRFLGAVLETVELNYTHGTVLKPIAQAQLDDFIFMPLMYMFSILFTASKNLMFSIDRYYVCDLQFFSTAIFPTYFQDVFLLSFCV